MTEIDPLELQQSYLILEAARRGEYLEEPIPDNPRDVIELAAHFAEEAVLAKETMDDPIIDTIIDLAAGKIKELPKLEAGTPEEVEQGSVPLPASEMPEVEPLKEANYASGIPPRSSGGYSEADLRGPQNLPIPKDWQDDPTDMPRDLTECNDREVRRLSSEYNGYVARARWLLVQEKNLYGAACHMRDEALRIETLNLDRIDPITDKPKTIAMLEAEAKQSEDYQEWANKAREHKYSVDAYETLVAIYSGNVSVLSREWTMRQDEYEKGR